MLETVAKELVEQGHEVTILCANGGYAKTDDKGESGGEGELGTSGFNVVRIGGTGLGRRTFVGKMIDYASFYFGVAVNLTFIQPKPDRIVGLTTPPYLSILARVFSKFRGADHAHWVMDLYPNVMVAHGMLSPNGMPIRFLNLLARWGFGGQRSKMVLTLGPDMDRLTAKHLSPETPRQWVPLWGTAEDAESDAKNKEIRESTTKPTKSKSVVLMYSGNMGLGHRFEEFLEAAVNSGPRFQWKFHGQGKRRVEVENFLKEHPDSQVTLGDYVPREELAAHLAAADVHLASLDPVWDGTMVPSKLQGIFAIGRPVIFVGSADCAMVSWIQECDGGWVVPPSDHEALKNALNESLDVRIREEKGRNAKNFSNLHFQASRNSSKVARLLSQS